jgi:hydrogenase maturation protein HypF
VDSFTEAAISSVSRRDLRRRPDFGPPVRLPLRAGPDTLSTGGGASAIAFSCAGLAFVGTRPGVSEGSLAPEQVDRDARHAESLLGIRPARIVHDPNPDDAGTRYARQRAAAEGLEALTVQRPHALMAACLAEHGLSGPVLGVCFDAAGCGPDGSGWGGDFLIGDCRRIRRAAHLEEAPLPAGGSVESREVARAYLCDAGVDPDRIGPTPAGPDAGAAARTVGRGGDQPTSSAARLFQGMAALLAATDGPGGDGREAQALESLARSSEDDRPYPVDLMRGEGRWVVRLGPALASIEKDLCRRARRAAIARRFHATVAEMIRAALVRLREESSLSAVVLCGDVFENALLAGDATRALRTEGFRVFRPHRFSSGGAAVCLGQIAVAAAGGGDPRPAGPAPGGFPWRP